MDIAFKVRENRVRRMAARQDLRLRKSARKDHRATGYGRYLLADQRTGTPLAGTDAMGRPSMTLAEAEAWLTWGGRR